MKRYWSEGGRQNPDFRHRVRVKYPLEDKINWCEEYPVEWGDGSFERYYIEFPNYDSNEVIFQFECEKPAIMFALKWQ